MYVCMYVCMYVSRRVDQHAFAYEGLVNAKYFAHDSMSICGSNGLVVNLNLNADVRCESGCRRVFCWTTGVVREVA